MTNVLITGGTRGIGRATALYFARKGVNVAFTYLNSDEKASSLEKEIESNGVKAVAIKANVSVSDDCNRAVKTAAEKLGSIDALINNAGISEHKLVCDMSDDDWKRMFAVNSDGVFYMSRAALPYLLNRDTAIVNVTSMWGIAGASMEVHYSASKAAVIGFTKAFAKEVGLSGIRVNAVAPGVIDTEMNGMLSADTIAELKEETTLGRIGLPEEAAKAIYFLASEDASFITGQVLTVDGGFVG